MYIFNHIPKCGGLSYRALLEEILGQDRVTHISINLEEEYHPDPDEYRQYTMLMGHFGVKWNEIVGPGRQWMTALREPIDRVVRSEEHTSELQSLRHLVCRLLLEKKK